MSEVHEAAAGRRANKRASAFRTIGEVAEDLDLPAHVLRFWESKFPQLKPLKRGGGRRYYRPEDITLLRRIRQCLYQDGYTIRGVQKLMREGGLGDGPTSAAEPEDATLFPLDPIPAPPPRPRRAAPVPQIVEPEAPSVDRAALEEARRDLLEVRTLLDQLRGPS
ncbi:MAG TPA: MerR family transcriptional regulator [Stellaceae bacterium]|nr:MerR family transcriptional regulator [Stellaceae bacterium]